jgi:hypothetical protein
VYILAAVDVEPVVVLVYTIMNADAVQMDTVALKNSYAVICAGGKENIPHQQILAAVEDY